jgi:hypothetical protein
MGMYAKNHKLRWRFLIGIMMGILLQFHYQFAVVIIGLLGYYLVKEKLRRQGVIGIIAGLVVGFSSMIVFELRNQFYHLNTLLLYWQNSGEVANNLGASLPPHYYQSIMIFVVLGLAGLLKKYWTNTLITIILLGLSLNGTYQFVVKPIQGSIIPNWSYSDELKVAEIIREQNLESYNVAMWYDTLAMTQKYLLLRDKIEGDFSDYKHNDYLFVVYQGDNWTQDSAYELNTFIPSKIERVWEINDTYKLYLAKRLSVK